MRRLFTFALDGKQTLPTFNPPAFAEPIDDPNFKTDDALVEKGSWLFKESCMMCHGAGAVSAGYAPDLRASPIPLVADAFKAVVVNGSLRQNGMPEFKDFTDEQLDSLVHFIRDKARLPAVLSSTEGH
jgi:quinohemoprotein ethanol dehydrogenase